jgi:hypothetical protein
MAADVGAVADRFFAVKDQLKALNEQVKLLEEEFADAERALIEVLDDAGIESGGRNGAKFRVENAVFPKVEDWGAYWDHIYDNRAFHLLEKRPAIKACRELFDLGQALPGVVKFTKRKIRT